MESLYLFVKNKKIVILIILFLCVLTMETNVYSQQNALNHFIDGIEDFEKGNYNEALNSIKKAIEMDPLNLEFTYYLGVVYSAMKNYKEALKIFESLVQKDSAQFSKAYFEIAAIHSKNKEYSEALDSLSKLEILEPDNARVFLEKAYVYSNMEKFDLAEQNLKKAMELNPDLKQLVYYELGAIMVKKEDTNLAVDLFNQCIGIDSTTAIAKNAKDAIESVKLMERLIKNWNIMISFAWAYDDNVPLDPLDIVNPSSGRTIDKGDQFQSLSLSLNYKFLSQRHLESGFGYTFSNIGYKEWVANNILAHNPRLYIQFVQKPVAFRLQYDFSYYYSGGDEDDQLMDGFYLTFGGSSEDKLRMHTISPSISIDEPYNLKTDVNFIYQNRTYLDGITSDASLYALGIVQSYKFENFELYPRVGYKFGYQDSDKNDSSYRYHEGVIGLSAPNLYKFMVDSSLSYIRTEYVHFPVKGDRRDRNYMFSFSVTRLLTERLYAQISYSYNYNESNVTDNGKDPYNFRKNVYLFGLTLNF
ncbi:MAG: tetratricopeptide repeat protein [Desulfobacterales bacterium]|nr:tetratricopeptide repeat protein [Desulfobacterales bacterium]